MELLTSTFERSSRYSRKAANLEGLGKGHHYRRRPARLRAQPALEPTLPVFLLAAE